MIIWLLIFYAYIFKFQHTSEFDVIIFIPFIKCNTRSFVRFVLYEFSILQWNDFIFYADHRCILNSNFGNSNSQSNIFEKREEIFTIYILCFLCIFRNVYVQTLKRKAESHKCQTDNIIRVKISLFKIKNIFESFV